MSIPDAIVELVERFTYNLDSYRSNQYNETRLRREFLDPFFTHLGWDVENRQGYAEPYKDVIHEDAIKIGGATKAPDYCFRIGGTRKFFVEAKKPAVNLKDDSTPAFQLRRYAWSAKLPLSILTDFEEFVVYDCRIKPNQSDKASIARLLYITCTDYASRWDEIAEIFSRDAILKGAFDKYADNKKSRRGTAEVDDAFLSEIEKWRDSLARNIALRNRDLKNRELNFAVQITIDRIIFLRICEDRGIETLGRLQALLNGGDVYVRLCHLFREADERYNSGLFHFRTERSRNDEGLDTLTPRLKVDDKVLKEIIVSLYYPSPYAFDVFPADILGQVYEQFLGKVIRLTSKHQAIIEEKPEVKKSGGVYYTPTYIVNYIVEQTVGKLLEGTNPKQAANLHILDPACGSGSFLIAAYQKLLDWHQKWYFEDGPDKHVKGKNPALYQGMGGAWRLTTSERKRILLANIFGVDIDAQAVEVTKLSLLLKVLEGETQESVRAQLSFALGSGRVLPDLDANIQCGNSLIRTDFYDGKQTTLFNEEEMYRVNAFDWKQSFPAILSGDNSGFDAVIGNPPYGFHLIHHINEKLYFKSHYSSVVGSYENYILFYEASLKLLNRGGLHGFIVPVTWLTIPSALSLRHYILDNFAICDIVWLPDLVFKRAQVNTLISIIQRERPTNTQVFISENNDPAKSKGKHHIIQQSKFIQDGYIIHIFEGDHESEILDKIDSRGILLQTFARPCSGYNPYEIGKGIAPSGSTHTSETIKLRPYHSTQAHDNSWKIDLIGRNLGRYSLHRIGNRFIKYGNWLAAPRDSTNFMGPRLLVQEIVGGNARRIIATYCEDEMYHSRDIIPIKCEQGYPSPLYILAIINSRLITWRHHRRSPKAKKALFPKVLVSDLKSLPILPIYFDDKTDKDAHDRIVTLVEIMLNLNEQLPISVPTTRIVLQRQIESTDRQIDQIVYELYGLTPDEIALIEQEAN